LNPVIRLSGGSEGVGRHTAIVIASAVCALVLPAQAEAHGRSNVIALDYRARVTANGVRAAGVRVRVIDGDRKLELTVAPARTVVVRGYSGEPFLRFSPHGVQVNFRSPTAATDRLVPGGRAPVLSAVAAPEWSLLTHAHRLAWHDHRLGPRAGLPPGAGRVAEWTIPMVVDGAPRRIEGALWRAEKPSLWPWLAVWLVALAVAVTVSRRAPGPVRRGTLYLGSAACGLLVLLVSSGFAFAPGRPGGSRWVALVVPGLIALVAAAVLLLRPGRRLVAAAVAGGFAFAAALEDLSVFRHGFVVSVLPAETVRLFVALALAAGAVALVVALAELWRGEAERAGRSRQPGPQPRLAIPKGKAR
jgi:hypothetical protein